MEFDEGDVPFPVQYRSDVDGDRYAIVDVADADLAGWAVEVGQDEARLERWSGEWKPEPDNQTYRREFTREHAWYRSHRAGKPAGAWSYYKLGNDTVEYPWSVWVDHTERILRWIPPEGQ